MRADVQGEFEEHAKKNADMRNCLPTALSNWKEYPYWTRRNGSNWQDANMMLPKGFDSVSLLKDNVASERCAILRYQEIADFTNGKDFTTCDIAKHILAERRRA